MEGLPGGATPSSRVSGTDGSIHRARLQAGTTIPVHTYLADAYVMVLKATIETGGRRRETVTFWSVPAGTARCNHCGRTGDGASRRHGDLRGVGVVLRRPRFRRISATLRQLSATPWLSAASTFCPAMSARGGRLSPPIPIYRRPGRQHTFTSARLYQARNRVERFRNVSLEEMLAISELRRSCTASIAGRRASGIAKSFQHRGHAFEDILFAERLAQYHASLQRSQNMNGEGIRVSRAHL
jgi:hypothetical protein